MSDYTFYRRGCENLDYGLDFVALGYLDDGETITSQTITVISGDIVIDNVTQSDGVVAFWATGTEGVIKITFTTSVTPREDCRTVEFIAL